MGNKYLKGSHVAQNNINNLVIVQRPTKEYSEKYEKEQVQCKVEYDQQTKDDPYLWTLNDTTYNAMIENFGPDETKWMGVKIFITSAMTGNGKYAIYLDPVTQNKEGKQSNL